MKYASAIFASIQRHFWIFLMVVFAIIGDAEFVVVSGFMAIYSKLDDIVANQEEAKDADYFELDDETQGFDIGNPTIKKNL